MESVDSLSKFYLSTASLVSANDSLNLEVPAGCIPATFKEYPDDPISHHTEQLITKVRGTILMPLLFLIGVSGTCLSLLVFYRQGLGNRINLCLFSLELVNLINVTYLFVINVDSVYLPIDDGLYGVVFRVLMERRTLGMLGFMYGCMYLQGLVSCERCISVMWPLRARSLFSTTTMVVVIVVGGAVTIFPFFAVVAWHEAACLFDPRLHKKKIGMIINSLYFLNEHIVNGLQGIYYGIILSLGIPIIVLIATIITGLKLKQSIIFRKQASSSDAKREVAITKMLVILSIQFLVLSIPNIIVRIIPLFEPEVRHDGRYNNTFSILINGAETGSIVNSSVNVFVYYFAGTKYREQVHQVLSYLQTRNDQKITTEKAKPGILHR